MSELLADVYEAYRAERAFDHLRAEGRPLVPGEGSHSSSVFIVGEAPGATENTQRRPFIGAAGQVLRSLMEHCSEIPWEEFFITNVLKYWPGPGNRNPTGLEIKASVPYLRREWAAVGRPTAIVLVGGIAKSAMLPAEDRGILQLAGKPYAAAGGVTMWPMIHPSYVLRQRSEDLQFKVERHWADLGDWWRANIQ
jgi:uracil-DNA glycosylase